MPRIDRACSAYLIEDGELRVLARLRHRRVRQHAPLRRLRPARRGRDQPHARRPFPRLDPAALRRALRPKRRDEPLPVWMPPGGIAMLRRSPAPSPTRATAISSTRRSICGIRPGASRCAMGAGRLRFAPTTHLHPVVRDPLRPQRREPSPIRADTAPDQRVIELARGTDLFLCEATLLAGEDEHGGMRGHSSAAEAAADGPARPASATLVPHALLRRRRRPRPRRRRPRYLQRRDHRRRRPHGDPGRERVPRLVIGFRFAAGQRELDRGC